MTSTTFNAQTDFAHINHHFEKSHQNTPGDAPQASRPSGSFNQQALDNLLEWSLLVFGDRMAQVTSFGPTGMVILDRLAKLSPGVRVITIDTDFLFDETYALWEEVQRRYPIKLEVHRSSLTPDAQAQKYGPKLWQVSANWCCYLRKVRPLDSAMEDLEAWLTGLRRDQSPTRAHLQFVSWDSKYQLVKLNPLATWNRSQVWSYIVENKVPYNPLHDRGFASIGCTHCTQPTNNSADERSGRWQGLQKTECGIHLQK